MKPVEREYPVGAQFDSNGHASLRVWAPEHHQLEVVVEGVATRLQREDDGHFSTILRAVPGARYGIRLPGDPRVYPGSGVRSLPDGPEGLSSMVDLGAYRWRDDTWRGVALPGQVIYEIHIGTCTAPASGGRRRPCCRGSATWGSPSSR